MWRQEDLFFVLGGGGQSSCSASPPFSTPGGGRAERPRPLDPRRRCIAAAPLMHGTAQFSAIMALTAGGAVGLPALAAVSTPTSSGTRRSG